MKPYGTLDLPGVDHHSSGESGCLSQTERRSSVQERPDDATLFGAPLTVIGPRLQVGHAAPGFTLIDFDPDTFQMSPFGRGQLEGKTLLLNVVLSLDTPVCHVQTKRWEEEVKRLPGVVALTISKDLPFAQARWKRVEGITHRTLSAFHDDQFASDYGVLLKEPKLLQRSVFVIDPRGQLAHVEYVREQTEEPNYEAAIEVVQAA